MTYKHVVHYDENANKVVISRLSESGSAHLYTEIVLDQLSSRQKSFEGLAKILGRALLVDTPGLRDKVE